MNQQQREIDAARLIWLLIQRWHDKDAARMVSHSITDAYSDTAMLEAGASIRDAAMMPLEKRIRAFCLEQIANLPPLAQALAQRGLAGCNFVEIAHGILAALESEAANGKG